MPEDRTLCHGRRFSGDLRQDRRLQRNHSGLTGLFLHGELPYQDAHGPMPVLLGQEILDRQGPVWNGSIQRKGLFISVGATRGKKLFDGVLLTVRYFFDAIDTQLWDQLLFRQLDLEKDILKHPEYLEAAYRKGIEFAQAVATQNSDPPGRIS